MRFLFLCVFSKNAVFALRFVFDDLFDRLRYVPDGNEGYFILKALRRAEIAARQDDALKPRVDAFADARFRMGNAPHFAREPHFAETRRRRVRGNAGLRARQREQHGEIHRRFAQADAPHRVEIYVLRIKGQPRLLFQNGEH